MISSFTRKGSDVRATSMLVRAGLQMSLHVLEILVLSQAEVDLVLHDTHRVAGKCV